MEATILFYVIVISLVACDPIHRNHKSNLPVITLSKSLSETNPSFVRNVSPIIDQNAGASRDDLDGKLRRRRSVLALRINGTKVCPRSKILIGNECFTCAEIDYGDERC